MPIFDYKCGDCGELFERIVSFSQSDKKQSCPKCNSKQTTKQFTNSVALKFKGDWYTNNKSY